MIADPQSLLSWLPEQRWFGHKDVPLSSIELLDEAILDDGPPALVLAVVSVGVGATAACYQLPLLVDEDGTSRDALEDAGKLRLLGELMAHGDTIKGTAGAFQFGGPGLDPLAPPPGSQSVRVIDAEQSNTSVVFDERIILKLFRRLYVGPNPDLELNRLLTNEGFDHVPAQVGEMTYEGEIAGDNTLIDLGIAQQFLGDAADGWAGVVRGLHAFYDEVDVADAAEDRLFLTEERAGDLLEEIAALGDVTASMHVALAREEADPDFVPEPMEESDIDALGERIRVSVDQAEPEMLKGIARALKDLATVEDRGAKIRVHGDLHLGQVMMTPRGWMLLDFEGEPLRTLEDRRVKQSPLKDVAGMLRSFDYAAVATLFERGEPGTEEWKRLEPWAEVWEGAARDRFLTAYLTRAHEGRFLPAERDELTKLLDGYELEKALYELAYERSHRPDWVRIPRHGIEKILGSRRPS